jgi:hypothetical protein
MRKFPVHTSCTKKTKKITSCNLQHGGNRECFYPHWLHGEISGADLASWLHEMTMRRLPVHTTCMKELKKSDNVFSCMKGTKNVLCPFWLLERAREKGFCREWLMTLKV